MLVSTMHSTIIVLNNYHNNSYGNWCIRLRLTLRIRYFKNTLL